MRVRMAESVVEAAALAWLEGLGYAVRHGPDIAREMPEAERVDYSKSSSRSDCARRSLSSTRTCRRKRWKMPSASSPSPPCATRCCPSSSPASCGFQMANL